MTLFIEQLVNALGLVGPILLVSVALASSIASLRLINVAVGGIYVLAAMIALKVSGSAPGPSTLLLLAGLPIVSMVIFEFLLFGPQRKRSRTLLSAEQGSFALSAALAAVLGAVASEIADGREIALVSGSLNLSHTVEVGGAQVQVGSLILFGVSLLAAAAWGLTLTKTAIGMRFRCVSQDRELAESVGIDVRRVALVNAVVSGALIGLATCMILIQVRAVGPESAGSVLLLPFAAVLLGGLDNIRGAVAASIMFGVISGLVSGYASMPQLANVAIFTILFAFLIVRPEGMKAPVPAAAVKVGKDA